jgi:hypothetical protein
MTMSVLVRKAPDGRNSNDMMIVVGESTSSVDMLGCSRT